MFNKKKLSLFIMTMFIFSIFFAQTQSAFGADQDPFGKMSSITSMQSNSDITIKVSADNLSQSEQQIFGQLLPIISNLNLKVTTKTVKSDDNNASAYMNIATSIMGAPLNMELWVKTDNKDGKPNVNEIIKMPNMPGMDLLKGKEYLVVDTAQLSGMSNASGAQSIDMSKYTELSKQLQGIITSFATEMKDKFNLITDKGDTTVTTPGGIEAAHQYEIKLDDTSFKALLKYSVDNLLQNTDFIKLVEQIVASAGPQAKVEDMDSLIKNTTTTIDKVLDSLKDVKLVSDKGIDYQYAVDNNGYIVNESGTVNLIIDAAKLQTIFNQIDVTKDMSSTSTTSPTGVYNISIDFTNTNYDINQNVKIDYPEINSKNSTNLMDMINSLMPTGVNTVKVVNNSKVTTITKSPTKSKVKKVTPKPAAIKKSTVKVKKVTVKAASVKKSTPKVKKVTAKKNNTKVVKKPKKK